MPEMSIFSEMKSHNLLIMWFCEDFVTMIASMHISVTIVHRRVVELKRKGKFEDGPIRPDPTARCLILSLMIDLSFFEDFDASRIRE